MFFINTNLETLFNMLKRLDCRRDTLNNNGIYLFKIHNLLSKHVISVYVKVMVDSIWKRDK